MIASLLHQVILNIDAKLLERGFNQLAAEMIALDQYETSQVPEILYGAITIGEVWRFSQLNIIILEMEHSEFSKPNVSFS
ncbi:hypothetical protein QUF74_03900 [Candidatus Halobeggiatoa sp. HSG11]|nr:hypothetical protein [Candidatus Halobeggiatoa sp. HSG11]